MSATEPEILVANTRKFLDCFSKYIPQDDSKKIDTDDYNVLVLKYLEVTEGMGIDAQGIDKTKIGERALALNPLFSFLQSGSGDFPEEKILTQYKIKLEQIEKNGLKDAGKLHALYSRAVFHQAWSDFNTILMEDDSLEEGERNEILNAIQTYLLGELLAPQPDMTFFEALATNLNQFKLMTDTDLLAKLNIVVEAPSPQQEEVEETIDPQVQLDSGAGARAPKAASSSSSFFPPPSPPLPQHPASASPIPPPQPNDDSNFWLQAGIVIVAVVLGVGGIGYMSTNSPGK